MSSPSSPAPATALAPAWTLFSREGDGETGGREGEARSEEARAVQAAWADGDRSGLVLGKFELLRRLGRGGMGEVYEALYRGDRRRYAVKILDRAHRGDPSMVTRFEHEFWALTRCAHPGVVAPHFSGEVDGELFYSMELLRGESLEEVLRRGPLAPARVVRIGVQLCEALGVLHDAGVLHRDLKPGNILLLDAVGDDHDLVKIVDLGIAKLLPRFYEEVEARTPPEERLRTKAGVHLGTPGYMAPEVGLGAAPAVTQDVFSLGVTLFRLATGRLPYPPMAAIEAGDEPRWSEELGRPLPLVLELVLRRAMTADPAMRTPTVERLREELEDVAAELDADSVAPAHDEPTARLATGAQGRGRTSSRVLGPLLWIALGVLLAVAGVFLLQASRPESRLSWSIVLARNAQQIAGAHELSAPQPGAKAPPTVNAPTSDRADVQEKREAQDEAESIAAPQATSTPTDSGTALPRPRSPQALARRWARTHDSAIQRCLGAVRGSDEVVVTLVLDRNGTAKSLNAPATVPSLASRCILDAFKGLDLGPDAPTTIRLTLKKEVANR